MSLAEPAVEIELMKAVRFHAPGGPEQLVFEAAPKPRPAEGEVLVRVYATGVTPTEPSWTFWETSSGAPRTRPIPGHEFSGAVDEIGPDVADVAAGDEVYAFTDPARDGSLAEYAIALPSELAPKPQSIDHVQAAAVPLSALTAWQGLFDHGGLSAGQTVLIHAAAGGVGTFAVQFAHWKGARVIGTASARNHDFLRTLGADEVFDYTATRFEEVVHDVDVVFAAVGEDTLERSYQVLRPGGVLVSIVDEPSPEKAAAHGIRALFFTTETNREQLMQIGDLIDSGNVRPVIDAVFPLPEARQAFERGMPGHTRGKMVLRVV